MNMRRLLLVMVAVAVVLVAADFVLRTLAARELRDRARERVPGGVRLVAGAIGHQARVLVRFPGLVATTRRGAAAVKQRRLEAAVKAPDAGVDTPLSTINRGFTAERRYARTWLPLEQVRRVKEAAGVTVNDVVLAVVAGALRSYLEARGELPARPLVASVPVGMEGRGAPPRTAGNRFSRLTTSLATDVADPWTRLATIAAMTREAKVCLDLGGRHLLVDVTQLVDGVDRPR